MLSLKHRVIRRASGVVAAGVLLTGSAPPLFSAGVHWDPCPADVAPGLSVAGLQCASVSVPLDYRAPIGPHIDIAVSKLPARKPGQRRGVLVLNPGGPGTPGLGTPAVVAAAAPAAVADTFDLVGFDPRGLGRSDPLDCGLTQQQTDALQPYPQPGGFAADVAIQRQIVKKCFARGGGKLAYVTTANTARDIDRIRIALGERKISYFGTSYGTYLGSVYASLFPSRTDRIVLDSAVGPGMVWRDQFRSWGPAMEIRFPDFAVWAAARAASYGFGATPAAVRATYFRLAAQLDAHPQGEVTGNVFRAVTRGGLVPNDYFEPLAAFWQAVSRGQAGQPAAARRDSAPSDSTGPDGSAVFLGIICNDVAWSKDLSTYRAQLALDSRRYPLAGSMAANVWPCAFWPVSPREPAVPITSNGPSNILILQNLRDPATIYTGGVQLRTTLGHRARLVSVDQGGHTVYLPGRNSCAAGIATDFLATGQLPAADRFCSAQPHTK